ncbi:hypothetical protein H1R20_g7689, partial [Candolleomyces eurysporus]
MFFADSDSSAESISATQENRNRLHNKLCQELGEVIPKTSSDWTKSLYQHLSSGPSIQQYLDDQGEYCNGQWTKIPEAPAVKFQLREPLCWIINSIVQQFGNTGASNSWEAIVDPLKCEATSGTEEPASPSITVRATGPLFCTPKSISSAFSNVAACIDVKLDSEVADVWCHLVKMSEYAKQIFIQQLNRFFVCSLVITEQRAQLFHFDRSGAQYAPLFNIHDHPDIFVSLILGLTTTDERTLGLDDSVQWTTAPGGKKVGGTLSTVGPGNVVVTYKLVSNKGPLIHSNLCGCGTTCWVARSEQGERLFVKDYWVTDTQTREFELLDQVKGLQGVCQMVSYEDNRVQTKDLWGDTSSFEEGAFHNRTNI